MIHVVALAHWSMTWVRGWCADSRLGRVRLKAENDRFQSEIELLREELRIKDARWGRVPARNRPHYSPTDRLTILELKAARGWSQEQAAEVFHVTPATIASWLKRLDEGGDRALVQLPVPVNRFPDFVRYVVQRLKLILGAFRKELLLFTEWYNEHRPNMALGGRTPAEVYSYSEPASEMPRMEPREKYPAASPCASPQAPIRGAVWS